MDTITAAIAGIAKAVAEFFGFQSKKLELKNAARVQAAQEAQHEVDAVDRSKTAVGKQDVKEVRNEVGE